MNFDELSTKQLLAMRDVTYKRHNCSCGGGRYHCGDDVLSEEQRQFNKDQVKRRKQIKAILATREHVPNKLERKQIRQEKARRK